jgi:hypothetical protein
MTRYLMDFCYHYNKEVCDETIRAARRMGGPLEPGDPIQMFPIGQEQEKLDEICESCPHGLFEVEEAGGPRCRVCHNELWNIDKNIIKKGALDRGKVLKVAYRLECPSCGKTLYSYINLWA